MRSLNTRCLPIRLAAEHQRDGFRLDQMNGGMFTVLLRVSLFVTTTLDQRRQPAATQNSNNALLVLQHTLFSIAMKIFKRWPYGPASCRVLVCLRAARHPTTGVTWLMSAIDESYRREPNSRRYWPGAKPVACLNAPVKLARLQKLSARAMSTRGRSASINRVFARSSRLRLT